MHVVKPSRAPLRSVAAGFEIGGCAGRGRGRARARLMRAVMESPKMTKSRGSPEALTAAATSRLYRQLSWRYSDSASILYSKAQLQG